MIYHFIPGGEVEWKVRQHSWLLHATEAIVLSTCFCVVQMIAVDFYVLSLDGDDFQRLCTSVLGEGEK